MHKVPQIHISKLEGDIEMNVQNGGRKEQQKSKQERMKEVRESTQSKFEEMRLKARNTVKSISTSSVSSVGTMGPIKSFGEL